MLIGGQDILLPTTMVGNYPNPRWYDHRHRERGRGRRPDPAGAGVRPRRPAGAVPLSQGIRGSEVTIFEDCSHAPLYENVEELNARTLAFLKRRSG